MVRKCLTHQQKPTTNSPKVAIMNDEIRFCTNCGAERVQDSIFCMNCGAKFNFPDEVPPRNN